MSSAVLLLATYTHVRSVYPPERRTHWSAARAQLYEVWRIDLSAVTRSGLLVLLLVLTLYLFRRFRQASLVCRPGPIEVAEFVNATGDETLPVKELSTAFRTSLGRVDLNSPAPVPGAGQPTEFLELLKGAANEPSLLGSVTGLLGLTWVTHAYRVTAILRSREGAAPFGVTVNVATLPRGGTTPHTVWAVSWSEAVEQAAIAVGAAVLPLTRLCRRPPWHDWRGLTIPPQLFAHHLYAKGLAQAHRYDEALGHYFAALELDPLNLHIRLEVGGLQEQLHLFLDALETYDDLIAIGTRKDERLSHALADARMNIRRAVRWSVHRPAIRQTPNSKRYGEGWRGERGKLGMRPAAWPSGGTDLHRALLLARYRYAMVLGFSEVVVAQWIRDFEGSRATLRDVERDRLRSRLLPRLSQYRVDREFGPPVSPTARGGSTGEAELILRCVTPVGEISPSERQRLEGVDRDLRQTIKAARVLAGTKPSCWEGHSVSSPGNTDGSTENGQRQARLQEFEGCMRQALRLVEDLRPAGAEAMRRASRGLVRASQLCNCKDKDWSDIKKRAQETLQHAPLPRRFMPEPADVLRAQSLLQTAAVREAQALRADYRWWKGRRRLGLPITSRALKVSIISTDLRRTKVRWLLDQQSPPGPAVALSPAGKSGPALWPPNIEEVDRRVNRAMRMRPWPVHEWQDHYNVACVYALPLLPDSWAGAVTGQMLDGRTRRDGDRKSREEKDRNFASSASRALEQAIDSSDSHFAAGRRTWLTSEDPDLVGYRGSPEYSTFQSRNFPGKERPVPAPSNVHVLQLATYVTEMLRVLAQSMEELWSAQFVAGSSSQQFSVALASDAASWNVLQNMAHNYRDWRSRLDLLDHVKSLRQARPIDSPIGYPSYPDLRIGDVRQLSDPDSPRCLAIASTYARQERALQFERLVDLAKYQSELGHTLAADQPRHPRQIAKQRRRSWRLLDECLAINFFTDDLSKIRDRKSRSLAQEGLLGPPTNTPVDDA